MPSPDMSKFLYTILKQLDLKCVDWNQVARDLGVTNGHASRMRYSRFKQQMEGHVPTRRNRTPGQKRTPKKAAKQEDIKDQAQVKLEPLSALEEQASNCSPTPSALDPCPEPATPEPAVVKPEPQDENIAAQLPLPIFPFGAESMPGQMQNVTLAEPVHFGMAEFDNLGEFQMDAAQFPTHYHYDPMMDDMMNYSQVISSGGQSGEIGFTPDMTPRSMDQGTVINYPIVVKMEERWDSSYRV